MDKSSAAWAAVNIAIMVVHGAAPTYGHELFSWRRRLEYFA